MKRKIRKNLRILKFRAFNSFFEKLMKSNKKFNVFDTDDIVASNLSLQPNSNNFVGRNLFFNFENIDLINQRNGEDLLEEDYPDDVQDIPDVNNPENSNHLTTPALPKIKFKIKNYCPVIEDFDFMKKEDLDKLSLIDQLKRLYSEINEISLAIESKIQILRLDFFRKFVGKEFDIYLKNKMKINHKIQEMKYEIRDPFCSILTNNKRFESEKEMISNIQISNTMKSKEKKKIKKKSREGKYNFILKYKKK
jgi:hypothetical protein